MANSFGNPVARYVIQGACRMNQANWTAIQVGTTPLSNRQWIQFQVRGTTALAVTFANRNANGTFTTPTVSGHQTMIYPRNAVIELPISEDVTVYGRSVNKIASTAGGCKVVVAEFA